MGRPRKAVPSYRLHRRSGNAMITVYSSDGRRRDIYLGRFNSPESKAEYRRITAEMDAKNSLDTMPSPSMPAGPVPGLTVAEMLCYFWEHAETYYKRGRELEGFSLSAKYLRELYDPTPAANFGPRALEQIRNCMIRQELCCKIINQRINRIKTIFGSAVSKELIPASVHHGLKALDSLKPGRSAANDHKPIKPVKEEIYLATLPHCPKPIAAMLRFLRETGCRPGELCIMRPCDLDTDQTVWEYTVPNHKTAHRGHDRIVFIGPKAKMILKPYLADCPPDQYEFSPGRERRKRFAEMREKRKTKVQPSQIDRAKPMPKKRPGLRYTPRSISCAVALACLKAGIAPWFPYQLRHAFASQARRFHGLEAAQVLLGHRDLRATQVYAERDKEKAREVAALVG